MQGRGGGLSAPTAESRVRVLKRELETATSRMEGRRGVRRRPENHPRRMGRPAPSEEMAARIKLGSMQPMES